MLNYRKHNLWRAFADFLFDNDGKSDFLKTYPCQGQSAKTLPYLWLKWPKLAKIDTLSDQNSWKTITFDAAHTYIAHIRECPPAQKQEKMKEKRIPVCHGNYYKNRQTTTARDYCCYYYLEHCSKTNHIAIKGAIKRAKYENVFGLVGY